MAIEKKCDVLVIGGGGAGLRAAVAAAEAGARVIVVDKGTPGRAGTTFTAASDWMAFGAAIGHADPADSPREHWFDILVKGCLVCRPELARIIAEEAPQRLMELEQWGADFDKTPDGKFVQKLSDGARFPRAAGKGTETGPAILRALMNRVVQINEGGGPGRIEMMPRVFVAELIMQDGRVAGAWGWEMNGGEQIIITSGAVVLACGGAGRAFTVNVFPASATGDGYALALRAGARLVNMEFIQIGPSIVYPFAFALSGVFWRLDPRVTNAVGEEFLPRYMPEGVELGEALLLKAVSYPFTVRNASMWIDVGVFSEIAEGRGTEHNSVFMDVSHNPPEVFETEAAVPYTHLLQRGLDISAGAFEFAPAVQHFNGGVAIDEHGATDVAGLFAAGENAGGQHGADRPGGNALADCQVFGRRAGVAAAEFALGGPAPDEVRMGEGGTRGEGGGDGEDVGELRKRLAWDMWRFVSVVRTAEGLEKAIRTARDVREKARECDGRPWERNALENMAIVAEAVARAALMREESRGTHYRADLKAINDFGWQRQIFWRLDGGELKAEIGPIIEPPEEFPGIEQRLERAF